MKVCWLNALMVLLLTLASSHCHGQDSTTAPSVAVARGGKAILPIVSGSLREPVAEVQHYLSRVVGDKIPLADGRQRHGAIYVAMASEVPWRKFDILDSEQFVIHVAAEENSLYVVGSTPLGVQHGVTSLLHSIGCRWFFPGETWEVIPRTPNLTITQESVTGKNKPSFPTQRRVWYGFGAYGQCKEDYAAWMRHNRMGGPLQVSIGHSWSGLNVEKDFETHPQWFAQVDGQRQPTKPCYSHPEVIAKAKQAALRRAAVGAAMITVTPPDGLGYCECKQCLAAARVKTVFEEKGSLFGKQADGTLVNVTSETVFAMANEIASAVAAEYPETLVGCYAYSAYSHPPSFPMHPNVYLQTTTAYRRTPLTLEEQVSAFGKKTEQLGIREYYSVYQWDWDYPDPGKMTPDVVKRDLSQFHRWGVTAVNAEASNNWAARGLGYYIAARLMWDVEADPADLVREFYQRAFGRAARPMQRYYVRWYGPSVAVFEEEDELPQRTKYHENGKHNLAALRGAYRDLEEAKRLAKGNDAILARIDHLRMYVHYLLLRYELEQAEATGDNAKVLSAVGNETTFGATLTYTNMLHTRPLLGKAFSRRFRKHAELLEKHPPAQQKTGQWRQVAKPLKREELNRLWATDLKQLGL